MGIEIDRERLSQLPENGCIIDDVPMASDPKFDGNDEDVEEEEAENEAENEKSNAGM